MAVRYAFCPKDGRVHFLLVYTSGFHAVCVDVLRTFPYHDPESHDCLVL